MRYDRMVLAYHGCDAAVAERLLAGEPFRESVNDYDWLGAGCTSGSTAPIARCSSPAISSGAARSPSPPWSGR